MIKDVALFRGVGVIEAGIELSVRPMKLLGRIERNGEEFDV